jgi:hypothetical protein
MCGRLNIGLIFVGLSFIGLIVELISIGFIFVGLIFVGLIFVGLRLPESFLSGLLVVSLWKPFLSRFIGLEGLSIADVE